MSAIDYTKVTRTCSVDGCGKPVYQGRGCGRGMCAGHYKRTTRGRPVNSALREHGTDPWSRLVQNALRLADAETEHDFQLAATQLRVAAYRYADARDAASPRLRIVGTDRRAVALPEGWARRSDGGDG